MPNHSQMTLVSGSLLLNTVATMAGLHGLIAILSPVSGAHLNPILYSVHVLHKDITYINFAIYICAGTAGAILGCVLAHVQHAIPVTISGKEPFGYQLWVREVIATCTLILIIHGCIQYERDIGIVSSVSRDSVGWRRIFLHVIEHLCQSCSDK